MSGLLSVLECAIVFAMRDLKVRYKGRILGFFWSLANPLCFSLVYWFAFKYILNSSIENYYNFLIFGLLPWVFLSQAIVSGTISLVNSFGIIRSARIGLVVFPLASVLAELINFSFGFLIVFIAFLFVGDLTFHPLTPLLLLVAVAFASLFVFSVVLSTAVLCVIVRDIQYVVSVGLHLTFFLTPVVYSISSVPEEMRLFFPFSPFFLIVEIFRDAVFYGSLNLSYLIRLVFFTVVGFSVSVMVLHYFQSRVRDYA